MVAVYANGEIIVGSEEQPEQGTRLLRCQDVSLARHVAPLAHRENWGPAHDGVDLVQSPQVHQRKRVPGLLFIEVMLDCCHVGM